jgi:hypothetical protein
LSADGFAPTHFPLSLSRLYFGSFSIVPDNSTSCSAYDVFNLKIGLVAGGLCSAHNAPIQLQTCNPITCIPLAAHTSQSHYTSIFVSLAPFIRSSKTLLLSAQRAWLS